MPRRTTIKRFPFLEGQHQEVDARVLPDGYLSACKNVRLRKDGRFGVRADFTAIGTDTVWSGAMRSDDLAGFGDALLAVGDSNPATGDTTSWDLARYAGTTEIDWSATSDIFAPSNLHYGRIGRVANWRRLGGELSVAISGSVNRFDCAAAGGLVCLVYQTGSSFSNARVFRASDNSVVLDSGSNCIRPRVVAVGSVFYFLGIGNTTGKIDVYRFNPALDTNWTLLSSIGATTIATYDAITNRAGTGFWLAINRTAPATTLVPVDTAGTAGSAITGPATLYDHVAVRETASRVHLLTVLAAGTCELRSYTTGGALADGPTTIVATSDRQPGLTDATDQGAEQVGIVVEQTASPNSVYFEIRGAVGHGVPSGGTATTLQCFMASKPTVGGSSGFHHIFGGTMADGNFFSTFLMDPRESFPYAYQDKFAGAKPSADHTPQIGKDTSTGKYYLPSLVVDPSGLNLPVVTEFDFAGHGRRQTTQIAGLLYLAGGALQGYDSRYLFDHFLEKPRITVATPSNGAGSLPSSTTLLLAVTWEWTDTQGRFYTSEPSDVTTVTMGVADDTIAVTYTTPYTHTLRAAVSSPAQTVNAVIWRSVSGVSQLRRALSAPVGATATDTATLLLSDTVVRANGVIYTQAGRGILSGTLPHEAPLPCDYIWKFGSRLLCANASGAFVSKEIFPGEGVNFSGDVGFSIPSISERIKGVAALDQRGFLFTAERIYWFSGDGPNDLGEGRYSEPLPLPSSTGLETWQSLVETPLGIFFQGSNGQLWVLPRDGSPPVWIGQPVRDTLVSFPVVTSATLVTEEQLVSFTCNNTGGTDARIVSYDLRAKTWIVDEFGSSTPITAACSYQGRLAMISSGIVYTEKTTLTPSTFIEHGLTTGTIAPFDWGKIVRFGLLGEYRGDCDLYARISYDDGKSFTTLTKIHQLRSASYAVGDTVDVEWTPARWKTDGFRLDFSARTPGSATEGFVFNDYWIETLSERGTSRRASTYRG